MRSFKISTSIRHLFICMLLLGFAGTQNAYGSHVVGSDVSYKCTSTPGIFEVTLVIYRNCDGGVDLCFGGCGAACTQTMELKGADPSCASSTFGSFSLSLVSVRDVGINPDCPNAKNTCNNMGCVTPGSYTPGIERYEFKGFANIGPTSGIPATCCNVRFSWELCCRNAQIATGGAGANFYMDAVINRCQSVSPCNSSPTLDNDPFAVMCGGENYVFNNGAIDPDYDSLSFSFAPALQGFNSSVPYDPPWAANKPMPWTGQWDGQFPAGIRCDPLTGDIMFTPQNTSGSNWYGIMAVEVKQWKTVNGVPTVIGITRRDIQMVVLANCPPNNIPRFVTNPPASGGNPNVPRYNWETCAGEQLCFEITAKDTDFSPPTISDTTYLSWNKALTPLGATFEPTYIKADRKKPAPLGGPREDKYQFCWTPTEAMASNTPYYFTVSAKDNRCPNPGRVTRAFSVKVLARADLTIVKNDLKCGKYQLTYINNKPKFAPSSVVWHVATEPDDYSLSQNPRVFTSQTTPVMSFPVGGKYLVMLEATSPGPVGGQPCMRVFYDTIKVDTLVKPFVRDTIVCYGNSVQLSATARYGQAPYGYFWYNSIKDTLLPPLNGAPVNRTITVAPSTTRRYTIKARDLNQCYQYDSVLVQVKQPPVGTLLDSLRLCFGNTYELDPGDNGGNIRRWSWNTPSNDTTRTITRGDSGTFIVTLTDTFNCQQTDTMKLFVNRQIFPNAGLDTTLCQGDTMELVGKGGYMYQWRDLGTGTIISPKQHNNKLKVSPTNTASAARYELTVYTSYPDTTAKYKECSAVDTVSLTVKVLPTLIRPQQVQSCRSATLIDLQPFGTNQPTGTGIWSYPPSPAAIVTNSRILVDSLKNVPDVDTTLASTEWVHYKYTAPASYGGCSRRDSARVVVYGMPKVNAGPQLIQCTNDGEYAITTTSQKYSPSKSGGVGETWSGAGIRLDPNPLQRRFFFNPVAPGVSHGLPGNVITYKFEQVYNPGLSTEIMCDNQDTVLFTVIAPPVVDAGEDVLACDNVVAFNIIGRQSTGNKANTTGLKAYWSAELAWVKAPTGPLGDSVNFDPSKMQVTGISPNVFKLYYIDNSTKCDARDSMMMRIARSPKAALIYHDSTTDSPYVCATGGKQVYFRPMITNAGGAWVQGSNGSSMVYGGSSSSFGANTSGSPSNAVFNSSTSAPGNYTLTMTYTDISTTAGCSVTASNEITVLPPPDLEVGPLTAICSYDGSSPVTLSTAPAAGIAFRWTTSGDGSFSADSTDPSTYTVGSGDIVTGGVTLTATTLPRILTGNGDPCAVDVSSQPLSIVKAADAVILATDTQGCLPLTSTYTAGPTHVSTPVSYKWEWENEPSRVEQDVASISRTVTDYNASKNGRYRVKLTVTTSSTSTPVKECVTQGRWADMITHPIPVSRPEADPDYTTIAKPYFNFLNNSSVADNSTLTYRWNLGPGPDPKKPLDRISTEANPVNVEYAADTTFKYIKLTATSEYGCEDTDSVRIRIDPDITVFIPNAFRPDDANNINSVATCETDPDCNRVFKVAANGHLTIEIFVYNRWGQQVFYSRDAKIGWNGRMMQTGELCPQDVYVYQVNATSFSGKQYRYAGSVTLLR